MDTAELREMCLVELERSAMTNSVVQCNCSGCQIARATLALLDKLERIESAARGPSGQLWDANTGYGIISEKDSDAIVFAFDTLRRIANGEV